MKTEKLIKILKDTKPKKLIKKKKVKNVKVNLKKIKENHATDFC